MGWMADYRSALLVCLVLSDIEDEALTARNSAIATLMRAIQYAGASVTVLHTGWRDSPCAAALATLCIERGIRMEFLPDKPSPVFPAHMRTTTATFDWLGAQTFDVVLFQDRHAAGHASIIAKTCGIAFERTLLGVIALGSSARARERKGGFPREVGDVVVEYMERRAVELADIVIAESKVADWMMHGDWCLTRHLVDWPDPSAAPGMQAEWCRSTIGHLPASTLAPAASKSAEDKTDTTVIVTHWEQPRLVQHNLEALTAQTDKSFEVIVIDDGSTSEEAVRNLDALTERYSALKLRVIRQANRYSGAARNAAIRAAKTEFIILLDDDNVAYPNMVLTLRRAIHSSGADIVTCAIKHFHDQNGAPDPALWVDTREHHFSAGPLLAGIAGNCFGDTCGIYRRDVFDRMGCWFHEHHGVTYEDWLVYLQTVAAGGILMSLPLPLLWYRVRPSGVLHRANRTASTRLIAAAAEELPGRSLAPLTDYLIGTSEELDYRKASIRALSNTLSKVESNLAQRVQEVAHLAHRLTESDQNGADLQRRIGESEAAHRRERDRCAQLQLERDRLRAELDKVESARSQLQAAVVQRDDLIRSVYQSTSWKILRPIRAISRLFARAAKQ